MVTQQILVLLFQVRILVAQRRLMIFISLFLFQGLRNAFEEGDATLFFCRAQRVIPLKIMSDVGFSAVGFS